MILAPRAFVEELAPASNKVSKDCLLLSKSMHTKIVGLLGSVEERETPCDVTLSPAVPRFPDL
jgi:hypothetical protein